MIHHRNYIAPSYQTSLTAISRIWAKKIPRESCCAQVQHQLNIQHDVFPASQTWVLIPNVWYSAPRIQNVRIYWISGLIWIITIGLWRLWWQNIKRAKWKYSRGELYSAAHIVEQSFRILNRFMKLVSFDTCSNEIVTHSIGVNINGLMPQESGGTQIKKWYFRVEVESCSRYFLVGFVEKHLSFVLDWPFHQPHFFL